MADVRAHPLAIEEVVGYTTRIDRASATTWYIGRAIPGSATSAAVWQIMRLTFSGGQLTALEWAGGNDLFDKIWNNRASLSYS
ncbi:MAG: hypothetical protein QXI19_11375 [Candidatus Caldarchaeum sp.]